MTDPAPALALEAFGSLLRGERPIGLNVPGVRDRLASHLGSIGLAMTDVGL